MTDEEYKKLLTEWQEAKKAADDFFDQFVTSTLNGVVTSESTRSITPEDVDKIIELRKKENELGKKWEAALKEIINSHKTV